MKLTCRYIFYVELYSGVVLFSLIFRVRVRFRHSLSNKQLFNFSENRRPEVVFIGVNYVTFVSGYDPSANLSGVLL